MPIIYPPRPKGAVPPLELPYFEGQELWCVQPKFNGSRTVIHISPSDIVNAYSRHGRPHLGYEMPLSLKKEILALPGRKAGVEYWLDGELLLKTKALDTKGKLVLFDILQEGRYFFGSPNQVERLEILKRVCGNPTELDPWRKMGYLVSENILMAPTFFSNFKKEFDTDRGEEVEGLVLRKRNSTIDNFGNKEYKVNSIIRCRKEGKHWGF